jgi:diacylglycerol kinase (ATP)
VTLIFCVLLVFFAEILNSALETLVDLATQEFDEKARVTKDAAAAAVLVLSIGSAVIFAALVVHNWATVVAHVPRIERQVLLGLPLAGCAALLMRSSPAVDPGRAGLRRRPSAPRRADAPDHQRGVQRDDPGLLVLAGAAALRRPHRPGNKKPRGHVTAAGSQEQLPLARAFGPETRPERLRPVEGKSMSSLTGSRPLSR